MFEFNELIKWLIKLAAALRIEHSQPHAGLHEAAP